MPATLACVTATEACKNLPIFFSNTTLTCVTSYRSTQVISQSPSLLGGFIKVDIDKDGGCHHNTLNIGSGTVGEVDFVCLSIRKELGTETLGFFHDHAHIRCITVRVGLIRVVKAERLLATSSATGVSFGAAIDAHATQARGWVDQIHWASLVIENLERRDAAKNTRGYPMKKLEKMAEKKKESENQQSRGSQSAKITDNQTYQNQHVSLMVPNSAPPDLKEASW
jgi:hypothetical protein